MAAHPQQFTTDWFTQNCREWPTILAPLMGRNLRALEVGSWEGRSALWLLENLLTHPDATLTCVDHWQGGPDHTPEQVKGVRERFFRNVVARYPDRVRVREGSSGQVLRKMKPKPAFDFIYIDGSHRAPDVLRDAVLAWPLLRPGGVLIFDDYAWETHLPATERPQLAIDAFVALHRPELDVLSVGYQCAIKKKAAPLP